MNTDISHRHNVITAAVLGALVGLAGLVALVEALLDATGHPVATGVAVAGVALLIGGARWVARRVQERREDAADTLAGAAWRAKHMPHLATQINNDSTPDRAGVA
jgi:hypothetical protein